MRNVYLWHTFGCLLLSWRFLFHPQSMPMSLRKFSFLSNIYFKDMNWHDMHVGAVWHHSIILRWQFWVDSCKHSRIFDIKADNPVGLHRLMLPWEKFAFNFFLLFFSAVTQPGRLLRNGSVIKKDLKVTFQWFGTVSISMVNFLGLIYLSSLREGICGDFKQLFIYCKIESWWIFKNYEKRILTSDYI